MLLQHTADPDSSADEDRGSLPADFDPERFDPWALDHALSLAAAWGAI
jgi:hypothetical protein